VDPALSSGAGTLALITALYIHCSQATYKVTNDSAQRQVALLSQLASVWFTAEQLLAHVERTGPLRIVGSGKVASGARLSVPKVTLKVKADT